MRGEMAWMLTPSRVPSQTVFLVSTPQTLSPHQATGLPRTTLAVSTSPGTMSFPVFCATKLKAASQTSETERRKNFQMKELMRNLKINWEIRIKRKESN